MEEKREVALSQLRFSCALCLLDMMQPSYLSSAVLSSGLRL